MVYKTYEKLFGFYREFDRQQKKAYWLLVLASAGDGITQGILLLQETIAKRALSASNLDITLIGLIANATMILAAAVGLLFNNRSKKWLLISGLLMGRLIFLASFLITSSRLFLLFLFCYHALFAIQTPVLNSFFKVHIGSRRGQAFAISRMALMALSIVSSLLVGRALDLNPGLYPWLLSAVAVSGTLTYVIFIYLEGLVDYRSQPDRSLSSRWQDFRAMLANRDFLMFETVFMTYGLAFMILVPVVPLMLLNVLGLSFFQMAQASGLYAQLFIMLSLPLAGLVYDRINIWRLWNWSLLMLVGYPGLMAIAYYTRRVGFAYGGYVFYSLGVTGVMILWNLGSLKFAGDGDTLLYQGFHVALTGVRGLIGPLVGYGLMSAYGFPAAFAASALLFLTAGSMSLACYRRQRQGQGCHLSDLSILYAFKKN